MSIRATVSHVFRPVGQGLFAQGRVRVCETRRNVVTWVHDCGCTGDRTALRREIERARVFLGGERRLDLLILSHFDADHVNGLAELLSGVRVGRVVLPYATLAERLLFAVDGGGAPDLAQARFLVDPVAHLRAVAREVEEFVFIDGSEGDGPLRPFPAPDGSNFPPERVEGKSWFSPLQQVSRPDQMPGESHFSDGAGLCCEGRWEFVFFNRRRRRPLPAGFAAEVQAMVDAVLARPELERDYDALVRELRVFYHRPGRFGAGALAKNQISLLTYAGPVNGPRIARGGASGYDPTHRKRLHGRIAGCARSPGFLYTGDITMRPALREEWVDFLGAARWRRVGPLQVPHHGSDLAWLDLPPDEWRHRWSVFSFGRNPYGHPGAATLAAFAMHGPEQVHEQRGFWGWYVAEWRT